MGPLKQNLVENISLQRCNCNIFGLTDTLALFAKEAGFYRFWVFFRVSSPQNEVALLEFNDLGCSVTPTFLFRNRFYLQLSPHYPKMNKKSMWEVKKISRFLSSVRKILPYFGCKAQGNYGR